jgi:hypothetical protein
MIISRKVCLQCRRANKINTKSCIHCQSYFNEENFELKSIDENILFDGEKPSKPEPTSYKLPLVDLTLVEKKEREDGKLCPHKDCLYFNVVKKSETLICERCSRNLRIQPIIKRPIYHHAKVVFSDGDFLFNFESQHTSKFGRLHTTINSVLNSSMISRTHFQVQRISDDFYLKDLSTYGTFITIGKETAAIKKGDAILLEKQTQLDFFGLKGLLILE